MKYYDREIYKKEETIKMALVTFIVFFIGFCFGYYTRQEPQVNTNITNQISQEYKNTN